MHKIDINTLGESCVFYDSSSEANIAEIDYLFNPNV